ncbi:hypothetical protein I3679_011655 [Proteus mirabilis]|uniref:Uncharacterized protein n=1 Tax=Proteus mirabilis TaxID=584 RepID=A0ABD5LSX0_PROMI
MGDYFRFIVPTVYATIADIPEELRKYIVVSDSLDFTKDRLLIIIKLAIILLICIQNK